MRLPEEEDVNFSINLLPMLDVIFAILAFLIVSTLFLTPSQKLPVNLPSAVTGETSDESQITLIIEADGAIALNNQSISLDNLVSEVKKIVNSDYNSVILINADEEVTHGKVVKIMDSLRTIDHIKLAIAVDTSNNE